jgi:hypothetical protein
MNADMEAAQILGAARSFMKTNDTPYSKIDVRTPEELLAFFVRICLTHSKRYASNKTQLFIALINSIVAASLISSPLSHRPIIGGSLIFPT